MKHNIFLNYILSVSLLTTCLTIKAEDQISNNANLDGSNPQIEHMPNNEPTFKEPPITTTDPIEETSDAKKAIDPNENKLEGSSAANPGDTTPITLNDDSVVADNHQKIDPSSQSKNSEKNKSGFKKFFNPGKNNNGKKL